MKKNIAVVFLFMTIGCASRYQIERHHNSFVRRMPQINRVETGRPVEKGSFTASAGVMYSLTEPKLMQASDSSFDSRSGIFGDEFTIITSTNTYFYESRFSVSGEGVYGFTDEISGGLSLDASGGKLYNAPSDEGMAIFDDNIEGSVFVKFAKKFGRFGVAIKPELVFSHLYGERLFSETDPGSNHSTATEELNFFAFAVRSSSVLRYAITGNIISFAGVHIKTQQLLKADDALANEVSYGLYGGIDCKFRALAVSPFIALPLGATTSHYASPVAAGMNIAVILKPKND